MAAIKRNTGKKGAISFRSDGLNLQYRIPSFDFSWFDYLIRRIQKHFKLVPATQEFWWIDLLANEDVTIKVEYEDEYVPTLFIYADTPKSNDCIKMIADYIERLNVDFRTERSRLKRITRKIDRWINYLYQLKYFKGRPVGFYVISVILGILLIFTILSLAWRILIEF